MANNVSFVKQITITFVVAAVAVAVAVATALPFLAVGIG